MRLAARIFAGPGLVLAGINHFVMPRTYEAIMPDYLPAHRELVYASGGAEVLAGLLAMNAGTRRSGGLLGIATLVAVFPANLNMALHTDRYPKIPEWSLYVRLPVQALMIYAVWVATQRD